MKKHKNLAYLLVIVLTAVLSIGLVVKAFSGNIEHVENFYEASNSSDSLGAMVGPNVYMDMNVYGTLKSKNFTYAIAPTSIYSTTTLTVADSGSTYLLSASGTTIILPDVTPPGVHFKFVIVAAVDTGNFAITSAETANIFGVILTGGVDYACANEDAVNFIADGEVVGDFVELYSDGTQWLIGANGGTTDAKITCTT